MSEIAIPPSNVPILLCVEPCDMRLGLPGLEQKIKTAEKDPKKRAIYIFVNKQYNRVKIFYWDRNGYALWYKHVEKATFVVDWKSGYKTITAVNLKELLSIKEKKKVTDGA